MFDAWPVGSRCPADCGCLAGVSVSVVLPLAGGFFDVRQARA